MKSQGFRLSKSEEGQVWETECGRFLSSMSDQGRPCSELRCLSMGNVVEVGGSEGVYVSSVCLQT